MTYLDLHFVCKICAEIHSKNPTKRQTNLDIWKIQVYKTILKQYNSRTSHFFSVHQNIIRHHNSTSFQLRNFIGPGVDPGVGHESTHKKGARMVV